MAALIVPNAFCGVVRVAYSAYKNKTFLQTLPLLVVELNTLYIWTCVGTGMIIRFRHNDSLIFNGSFFKNGAL